MKLHANVTSQSYNHEARVWGDGTVPGAPRYGSWLLQKTE